jgi:hypothetical protein
VGARLYRGLDAHNSDDGVNEQDSERDEDIESESMLDEADTAMQDVLDVLDRYADLGTPSGHSVGDTEQLETPTSTLDSEVLGDDDRSYYPDEGDPKDDDDTENGLAGGTVAVSPSKDRKSEWDRDWGEFGDDDEMDEDDSMDLRVELEARLNRYSASLYSPVSKLDGEWSPDARRRFVSRVEAMIGGGVWDSLPPVPKLHVAGGGRF